MLRRALMSKMKFMAFKETQEAILTELLEIVKKLANERDKLQAKVRALEAENGNPFEYMQTHFPFIWNSVF